MSGVPITQDDLNRLFEAARWAPSSNNNQPGRFLYARADTPPFAGFFDLLVEGNKAWCQRAGALVIACSKNTFDNGKPARTHSFDTGAAWMSLALQGTLLGLVVHGMQGFDYDRARVVGSVPEDHQVECMIAIGHPGKVEDLPEKLREREAPNDRKPVSALAFEGGFGRTG